MNIRIRIFLLNDPIPIYEYVANQSPQKGDLVCIESEKVVVKSVEWSIIDSQAHADIYCNKLL